MFNCNKGLTPLQNRTKRLIAAALLLLVGASVLARWLQHGGHTSIPVFALLTVVETIPVLFTIWIIGRYLHAEPDEFIRSLVTRSLLWGFAAVMIGNAFVDVQLRLWPGGTMPLLVLDAELFIVSTAIALRLQLRSYR